MIKRKILKHLYESRYRKLRPFTLAFIAIALILFAASLIIQPSSAINKLVITRIVAPARDMVVVDVVNRGSAPATIAQVLVDGAYWEYVVVPSAELPRGGQATLRIPYPWEPGVSHRVVVLAGSGATVEGRLPGAAGSATFNLADHWRTLLLGLGAGTALAGLWLLWRRSRKAASP